MGCCGSDREKLAAVRAEQKWEYINLDDFKSNSCWVPFTYGFLWLNLFISVSVYAVDTFTAVNLLVFDRWSGQIKPAIPLNISRWIFAGCIILSFVLLFYRWLRAIRVMKGSGVAQSYLDPLAVRIQSVRLGKEGRGWKRFLVFAELTKSRKGADYVALFTFYSFEAWTRIVFAEGPRQVINALTLYSVLQADLLPQGKHAPILNHTPLQQFFDNVGALASANHEQAVVLIGMLWTLVIWVISALSLIASLVLYLLFLFHHIPSEDGSLSNYCRRKINRRAERIIREKVDKALKKEDQLRARQDAKGGREIKRQPTLPTFDDTGEPAIPGLSRQPTQSSLPEYTSRDGSSRHSDESLSRQPTLPDVGMANSRPPPPSRTATQTSAASWASYGSKAPLIRDAAGMGYSPSADVQTPASATSAGWPARPPPSRSMTGTSQPSQRSYTPGYGARSGNTLDDRSTPATYPLEPLSRPGTGMNPGSGSMGWRGPSPSPSDPRGRWTPANQNNPYFPPLPESGSFTPVPRPGLRSQTPTGTVPPPRSFTPGGSRSVTSDLQNSGRGSPSLPRLQTAQSSTNGGYEVYSPNNYSSMPTSAASQGPYRSFSQPSDSSGMSDHFCQQTPQPSRPAYTPYRSGTAPLPQRQNTHDGFMDDIVSGYR